MIGKAEAAAVLNVAADAAEEDIRRAWRTLALKCHPDKNPGDSEAAARFREVTAAYEALSQSKCAFKSFDALCAEMDDARNALQRAMELASRPTPPAGEAAGGGKGKILRMGGATWIGECEAGRPHGRGDLILASGTVHRGLFDAGRACGAGELFEASGSIHRGEWVDNKRFGEFATTDPKGGEWRDTYDGDGKRVARKKVAPPPAGAAAAVPCRLCGAKFFAASASTTRCLQHSGTWLEAPTHNADGSAATVDTNAFPEGGLWLCCGAKAKAAPGCTVGVHQAAAPPPPVPEERRIAEAPATAEPAEPAPDN